MLLLYHQCTRPIAIWLFLCLKIISQIMSRPSFEWTATYFYMIKFFAFTLIPHLIHFTWLKATQRFFPKIHKKFLLHSLISQFGCCSASDWNDCSALQRSGSGKNRSVQCQSGLFFPFSFIHISLLFSPSHFFLFCVHCTNYKVSNCDRS